MWLRTRGRGVHRNHHLQSLGSKSTYPFPPPLRTHRKPPPPATTITSPPLRRPPAARLTAEQEKILLPRMQCQSLEASLPCPRLTRRRVRGSAPVCPFRPHASCAPYGGVQAPQSALFSRLLSSRQVPTAPPSLSHLAGPALLIGPGSALASAARALRSEQGRARTVCMYCTVLYTIQTATQHDYTTISAAWVSLSPLACTALIEPRARGNEGRQAERPAGSEASSHARTPPPPRSRNT